MEEHDPVYETEDYAVHEYDDVELHGHQRATGVTTVGSTTARAGFTGRSPIVIYPDGVDAGR